MTPYLCPSTWILSKFWMATHRLCDKLFAEAAWNANPFKLNNAFVTNSMSLNICSDCIFFHYWNGTVLKNTICIRFGTSRLFFSRRSQITYNRIQYVFRKLLSPNLLDKITIDVLNVTLRTFRIWIPLKRVLLYSEEFRWRSARTIQF